MNEQLRGMRICALLSALLLATSALGATLSHGASGEEIKSIVVTEADNGREVALVRGQQLVIRLQSQLGTGFTWLAEPDIAPPLRLVEKRLEAGPRNAPGAFEFQVFVLAPIESGTGSVHLVYRQPWMKGQAPARRFELRAIIR